MYGVVIDPNRLNGGFCTAKNTIDSADYSFVNVWESHEYLSGSVVVFLRLSGICVGSMSVVCYRALSR